MHAMQHTNASTKCNHQASLHTTDYYRFLPLALTRASHNQTCSDTKPVAPRLRETGTPCIPAQRSRSLWNTTLLDIERMSSYYKNNNTRVWCYKEAHQHDDTTPAKLHLLYASSGTTRSSGILLAAEQRRRWWTPLRRDSGWDTI